MSRSVALMVCELAAVLVVLVNGVAGQSNQQQQQQQDVVVNTPLGDLRGVRTPVGQHSYVDRFLAIPFAMPPVADGGSGPLPVMVWIHGGGYKIGTASGWDFSQLAAKGIVVVTTNYRLSALGFLSTEDAESLGNYGLLDQIRALEWVRDVISSFNGDPNDVTIVGESAGASSVSLQTLSRKGRGLFHKAIMESGNALTSWAISYPRLDPDPKAIAWQLASALGCNSSATSASMLACLRTKSFQDVQRAADDIASNSTSRMVYKPVKEAAFGQDSMFSAMPETLLGQGRVNVPVLIGFNKNEMALQVPPILNNGVTKAEFQGLTGQFVHMTWDKIAAANTDMNQIIGLCIQEYAGNFTDPLQLREAYIQMISDYIFVAPTIHGLMLVKNSFHPVTQYLYQFSHRSANRLNKQWQGVVHADELHYVMGSPVNNDFLWKNFVANWTDDDRRVSEEVMTLWSNFVKRGNPNSGGHLTKWWPWRQDRPQLMDIRLPSSIAMDMPISWSRLRLWNEIIPTLLAGGSVDSIIG